MAHLDELMLHREQMVAWLTSVEGKLFISWQRMRHADLNKELKQANDTISIYRAQGELAAIEKVLNLQAVLGPEARKKERQR